MTDKLEAILQEIQQDTQKEKLCLIEDIFKVKRMLFGFGHPDHENTISEAGEIFNTLLEMQIGDLQDLLTYLSSEMSAMALKIADTHR